MTTAPPIVVPHRPGRRAKPVLALMLLGAVVSVGLVFALVMRVGLARRDARLALTPDANVAGLMIPEFTLTDQHGAPVTRQALLGRVTIVDFFFTNCPFVCPMLSHNMLDLQKRLAGEGVRFLSVSVDPANDTAERLREYATNLGADLATWTFVRGDLETVRRISEEGLTLGVADDPTRTVTLGDGRVMNNIAHSSKLVLIGPDGAALAMRSGMDGTELDLLEARARTAARALAVRHQN